MLLKRTETNGVINALYESSNVLASKYDGTNLTVIFKNGGSYTYKNVKNTDYTRFETTDSQGTILNTKIKKTYKDVEQNDNVDATTILTEINQAKADDLKKFEEGMVEYMRLISTAYEANPTLTDQTISSLSEMIIKRNELRGSTATLKLCKCD